MSKGRLCECGELVDISLGDDEHYCLDCYELVMEDNKAYGLPSDDNDDDGWEDE